MKLKDAIKDYILDAKIAPQTPRHIEQKQKLLAGRLIPWCDEQGVIELAGITPRVIKGFAVHLQESKISETDHRYSYRGRKLSPVTVHDYMRVVRAFFKWCEDNDYLDGHTNPVRQVPRTKVPKRVIAAFSPEQLQTLLDACDTSSAMGFRDYTILLVFMDTGMRVSEICDFKMEGVHDDFVSVVGKGDKERELGISPVTTRALWRYIHQYRKPAVTSEQHVFLSRVGGKLWPQSVWKMLRRRGEEVGIQGVRISPHTLRHSFAKGWLKNGGDLFSLSRVLGHTDIQTTKAYLEDFKDREAREQHSKYSPVVSYKLGRHPSKKGIKRGGKNTDDR